MTLLKRYSGLSAFVTVVLAFLLASASAIEVNSLKLSASIPTEGRTTYLSYSLVLENNGSMAVESVELFAPPVFDVLYAKDDYGDVLTGDAGTSKIGVNFPKPISIGEERILLLKLRTSALVSGKTGYNEFLLDLEPSFSCNTFDFSLKLPENSTILYTNSPKEASSVGGIPQIEWSNNLLSAGVPLAFIARYRPPETLASQILAIAAWAFLAIALLVAAFMIVRKLRKKAKLDRALELTRALSEKDAKVLREIILSPGISQYKLREKTELNKSNLSKILSKLAVRGLLQRSRHGKINKIYPGPKVTGTTVSTVSSNK